MKIIIIGPPGSGKGSQAELLQKKLRLKHIPLGEILRQEIKKNTVIGKKVKSISMGILAQDYIVDKLINKIIKGRDNFILDGYPRRLAQARYLDKIIKVDRVFLFDIPKNLIIKRLSNRYVCMCGETYNLLSKKPKKNLTCDKCKKKLYQRDDDKIDVIKRRIELYNKQTKPVIDYYRRKKILFKIDSSKSIENVFNEIKNKLYKH
ncbi:nucleoside monophosphate kinase [Candidatus Woesearchaeota archaeon]|nr:nucleoside monophosphate kinase [Candidatus Woesearchaeota archaeon]